MTPTIKVLLIVALVGLAVGMIVALALAEPFVPNLGPWPPPSNPITINK